MDRKECLMLIVNINDTLSLWETNQFNIRYVHKRWTFLAVSINNHSWRCYQEFWNDSFTVVLVTSSQCFWDTSECVRFIFHSMQPNTHQKPYYRPQRSYVCMQCFYRCVWFCSQGGGCLPQCMLGYHTPHPPGADTPWSRHPPGSRHPPTQSRHPREQTAPLGADPPPPKQTTAYGQRAAGTHPTGMNSCASLSHFYSSIVIYSTPFSVYTLELYKTVKTSETFAKPPQIFLRERSHITKLSPIFNNSLLLFSIVSMVTGWISGRMGYKPIIDRITDRYF